MLPYNLQRDEIVKSTVQWYRWGMIKYEASCDGVNWFEVHPQANAMAWTYTRRADVERCAFCGEPCAREACCDEERQMRALDLQATRARA